MPRSYAYIQSTLPTAAMEELSLSLEQNIKTLNTYLDASELPRPSFDRDTPAVVLPQDAPQEVQDARHQIMDASLRLFRLAAGPSEYMSNFRTGVSYGPWYHPRLTRVVQRNGSYPMAGPLLNIRHRAV